MYSLISIDNKEVTRAKGVNKKLRHTQPAFTCSKLTIETLEQGV